MIPWDTNCSIQPTGRKSAAPNAPSSMALPALPVENPNASPQLALNHHNATAVATNTEPWRINVSNSTYARECSSSFCPPLKCSAAPSAIMTNEMHTIVPRSNSTTRSGFHGFSDSIAPIYITPAMSDDGKRAMVKCPGNLFYQLVS